MYLWTPFLNYVCFLGDSFEKFISFVEYHVCSNKSISPCEIKS